MTMLHPDELAQAVRDKQLRYRHEAYRGRIGSRPHRDRVGTRLITLGESIRGEMSERMEPMIANDSQGSPA